MSERSRYGAKRWKGKQYDYDAAIIPAECSYLICLSDREIELLLAGLEYLRWSERWYSPTGATINPETILYIANEIQRALMSQDCGCGNSSGSCTCQSTAILNILMAWQWQQADTGDPRSYAPHSPDTAFDVSTDDTTGAEIAQRSYALCYAVDQYINAIIQEAITRSGVAAGVLIALGGVIAIFLPLAGFVITVVGSTIGALLQALDDDLQAIENVKCCMLNGLKGQTPTFENFRAALGDCGFTFGTNEAQLAAVVNANNQEEKNFRAFMVLLETAYPVSTLSECSYCDEDWCYEIDLTAVTVPAWLDIVEAETSAGAERTVGIGYHALNIGEQITVQVLLPPGSRLNTFALQLTGGSGTLGMYTYKRDETLDTQSWGNASGWAVQQNITDSDPFRVKMVAIYDYALTRLFIAGNGSPPFGASDPDCTPPF